MRPLGLLLALALPASACPEAVGESVDADRSALWPVRVRGLERVVWTWVEGSRTGFPAPLGDGSLRIQAGGGGIRAVDVARGKRSWLEPGSMGHWNYSACVLGPRGVAYGGDYDWVRAVDAGGKRLWEAHLGARTSATSPGRPSGAARRPPGSRGSCPGPRGRKSRRRLLSRPPTPPREGAAAGPGARAAPPSPRASAARGARGRAGSGRRSPASGSPSPCSRRCRR